MSNYVRVGPFVDSSSPFLSAANLNLIDVGIFAAHYQPAARVFHSANQATVTAVALTLAFNSERFDTEGNAASTIHDNAVNNSRLTCRTAGIYQITANVEWAGNTAGARTATLRLNGATNIASGDVTPVVAVAYRQSISTLYQLAVNDYIETVVTQTSGGNLNVLTTANYSPEFMMVRVG